MSALRLSISLINAEFVTTFAWTRTMYCERVYTAQPRPVRSGVGRRPPDIEVDLSIGRSYNRAAFEPAMSMLPDQVYSGTGTTTASYLYATLKPQLLDTSEHSLVGLLLACSMQSLFSSEHALTSSRVLPDPSMCLPIGPQELTNTRSSLPVVSAAPSPHFPYAST
ncbi:hypothetical protein OH76DRAFT_111909 [Lentinus brumalis]|uniref:Uncharacterized protein n=1 Tax=Lentinus brumalis TaxID=2498619 RepID=A0A371CQ40_9APHY|nr:hypothetical protein OH76DRAFT_111909 [Polyporus brumalis]